MYRDRVSPWANVYVYADVICGAVMMNGYNFFFLPVVVGPKSLKNSPMTTKVLSLISPKTNSGKSGFRGRRFANWIRMPFLYTCAIVSTPDGSKILVLYRVLWSCKFYVLFWWFTVISVDSVLVILVMQLPQRQPQECLSSIV